MLCDGCLFSMNISTAPASKLSLRQLGVESTHDASVTQTKLQPPDGFDSFENFLASKAGKFDKNSLDLDKILHRDGIPYKEKVEKQIDGWVVQLLNDVKTTVSSHGKRIYQLFDTSK